MLSLKGWRCLVCQRRWRREVLAEPCEERGAQEGSYHESLGQEITAYSVSALCAHCAGVSGEISVNASSTPCGIMAKDCATEQRKTEKRKRLIANLLLVLRLTV